MSTPSPCPPLRASVKRTESNYNQEQEKESYEEQPSEEILHPSASAPRKSEAFKRLGQANLVSSSIFKSNHHQPIKLPSSPIKPSNLHSAPINSNNRIQHTPLRPTSQMAAALKNLGIVDPTSSNPPNSPSPHPPPPPPKTSGTKRKSDENLPPPRPAPGLSHAAPSLHTMPNHSRHHQQASSSITKITNNKNPKPAPRKSSAYDALTRNALVSSSPFKAHHQPSSTSINPTSSSPFKQARPPLAVSPPGSSSEEVEEGSSNESDPTPGTPPPSTVSETPNSIRSTIPSPRSSTNSSSVLKHQRLGGPRSFTPPPYHQSNEPEESSDLTGSGRPQSAMSTPGKRRERRKTVTWGGEDVLEFEREEEWRKASGASSVDSYASQPSVRSESESEEEEVVEEVSTEISSSSIIAPQQHHHPSEGEEDFWGRASESHQHHRQLSDDQADQSTASFVVHEDHEQLLPPSHSNLDQQNGTSFSSDTDPVDRMVDDLLTSPHLAGLVKPAMSMQGWTMPAVENGRVLKDESLSLEEQMKLEDDRLRNHSPSPLKLKKSASRFPYLSSAGGEVDQVIANKSSIQSVTADDDDTTAISIPSPADESSAQIMDERAPFRPISLPGLDGPDDSLFTEGSFVSSILQEPSFLGTEPINSAISIPRSPGRPGLPLLPTAAVHGLSSTPRASFATDPPSPQPVFPESLSSDGRPTQTLESINEHASSALFSPTGASRRPLPRVPPPGASSSSLPLGGGVSECSTTISALTAPAYTLPDLALTSPFVGMSNNNNNARSEGATTDSPSSSPGGGRQRITREKIQERMRGDRSGTKSPEPVVISQLAREQVSQAASLHRLTSSGNHEERVVEIVEPLSLSRAGEMEIPREIPARPPLKARVATLSDSIIRPLHNQGSSDQTLRQEDMDAMSSGLDKLANAFQPDLCFEDEDELTIDTLASPEVGLSSSKLIQVKGVGGRRRRSLSTGAADVEETGTGAGARAAVKSNSIKPTAPLSKRAQASSALLTHAVQRGMDDTDFQAPLDRALQKIMDNGQRTYRIQESEEVVYASDNRTATVGDAGDVVDNRNWRKLRKVSDINEHEKQLKAFWASNGNSTKIGKVFVKMSKLAFNRLPVLARPVWFEVIIDNGLHTAKTAAYKLEREVTLGVEFELVRAKKLEFSLAFNIPLNDPRNAHLRPRRAQPATTTVIPVCESPKRGLAAKLFGSGHARRNSKQVEKGLHLPPATTPPPSTSDPLLALLDRDGTLARALVNFDEYADEALGQLKAVVIPCSAALSSSADDEAVRREMRGRVGGGLGVGSVGQITLEFLSLPPLPKVPDAVLPNSSGECLKGLRIAEWWQEVWHTGVLSQMGADCQTWRRRTFKATGGSLFAYNDIMNKLSAEIRLSEVLRLEDAGTPGSPSTSASSSISETGEILPPFTFRLVFKDGSEILFHADGQEEFRRWKNVLGQLVGKIQALPVWAELLRLQIAAKQATLEEERRRGGERGVEESTTRKPGRRAAAVATAKAASASAMDGRSGSEIRNSLAGCSSASSSSRPSSSATRSSQGLNQQHPQRRAHPLAGPSRMSAMVGSTSTSTSRSNSQQPHPHPTPAAAIKRSMNRMDLTK
ncbi:hypothetical protein CROQUDRAFT_86229 [Cronartium quercuum f. sp. fusiforme G11]|uniref:PH domain-containing protein n=1 Tax=Cronartium quercuum f. sp. fusiforme G11 TaxID=708437 RepID=A0A9P6NX45_9BASI|nr:hypothetical protein CROQUDRAFT_86229 [Cronartium quercuum f. sp. fusiforme G11]